jgi:hypothetical protein
MVLIKTKSRIMKTQLLKKMTFALSVGLGLLVTQSCQKEVTAPIKSLSANEAAEQINIADELFYEMLQTQGDISSRSMENENGGVITINENTSPKQLIADYGSGIVGADGKTRSGKVILNFVADDLYTIGNKIEASFENYKINNNLTDGKMSVHNVGYDVNNHVSFKVTLSATHNMANGKVSIKSANKISILAGFDTPRVHDDVLQFDGKMTGVLTSGEKFEITNPSPLVRNREKDCNQHHVSGVSLIKVENQADRYIDYGNGACDNLATETVDGVSKTITLN